jgi:hypothetical protein
VVAMLKQKTLCIKNLQENLEPHQKKLAKKEQQGKKLTNKINKIKQIKNQQLFLFEAYNDNALFL